MKKLWIMAMAAVLLCGCARQVETAETVADLWEAPALAAPREIRLELPGEALECAMESDTGRLYLGSSYDVEVQTLSGGDLDATIRSLTGFSREEITLMQTRTEYPQRWEFAWGSLLTTEPITTASALCRMPTSPTAKSYGARSAIPLP